VRPQGLPPTADSPPAIVAAVPGRVRSTLRKPMAGLAAWCGLAACGLGCAAPDDPEGVTADSDGWEVARTCLPPPGLGRPEHIGDVVALVNALPMPVTLPCVLEALQRPLVVVGATSPFSAQATTDIDSPRLFVFSADLVPAIVTVGDARALLEMGEYVETGRTLKAEIEFPVAAPLPESAPFAHLLRGESTSCSLCHDAERYAGKLDEVSMYTTQALAPEAERLIPIGLVEQYARDCDPERDAERCALLEALFAHGDVTAGSFRTDTRICVTP
jgi:hypothetical protein